jgi:hypothetical protein
MCESNVLIMSIVMVQLGCSATSSYMPAPGGGTCSWGSAQPLRLPKTEPSTVSIYGLKSAVAGIFMTTKFSVKKHFLRFAIDAAYRKPDTYHFLTLPACAFFA